MANSMALDDEENKKLMGWIGNTSGDQSVAQNVPGGTIQEKAPEEKIQDSAPGNTADDLTNYLKGQSAQLDKYGPEQEKAVMDSIAKSRGSFGNRAATFGAGIGDALMSVSGHQSPGFLNSLENDRSAQEKQALESIPTLAKLNSDKMGDKMKLDGMTSSTPLGASQVAPLAAFFKTAGVPEKDIPGMLKNPAAARAVLEPFAQVMSNQQKIQMETLLKQLELNQRGQQIKGEQTNQAGQRKEAEDKLAEDKKKTRMEHPFMSAIDDLRNGTSSTTSDRISVISPTGKVGHIPASQLKDALAKGYKQQ